MRFEWTDENVNELLCDIFQKNKYRLYTFIEAIQEFKHEKLRGGMITVMSCEQVYEVNGKPVYKICLSDGRFGESYYKFPIGMNANDIQIET